MSAKKILVIAHYNRLGKLRPDTADILPLLQTFYDQIYLISTNLNKEEFSKIPNGIKVHVRENIGYDFYSYRMGILELASNVETWENIDRLTIMNTSFLIFNLELFVKNCISDHLSQNQFDAFGLTKSFEFKEHLQSFLITFSSKVLKDLNFLEWWKAMTPINDREEVIKKYEFGLSDFLISNNNTLGACLTGSNHQKIQNPSHSRYQELFNDYGVLKIEAFKSNPFKLNLKVINQQIKQVSIFKKIYIQGLNN